jgi:Mg2+ and Co2+ transporter CorA
MNVQVPGQDAEGLGWFFSLVGLIFLIGISMWLFMRYIRVF